MLTERQIAVIPGDGLDDCDDDGRTSIIRGVKLKFTNDAEWEGDDEAIEADREFLVAEILKTVQKWIGGRPIETRVLAADEKFPDIDALNDEAPDEEWVEKFGRKVGPWERAYIVYLLDPETMQVYTFPTSSDGGGRAVRELRQAASLARRLKGPGIYPRVRLTDVHMNTQFGGRQRPHFEIVGYETLGSPALAPAEPKQIVSAKPEALNDPIPDLGAKVQNKKKK
jgi:hypothetical protein